MTVDETAGSGARTAVVRGLAALGVTSLLLAAGLAGCTAIGNGSTATPAPAASSSSSPIAEEPQSPLAPYLYGANGDPDVRTPKEQKSDSIFAECMKDAGFTYVNINPDDYTIVKGPDSREEREKHGLGWVEGVVDPPDAAALAKNQDPNEEYYESLSEAEQKAYNTALFGRPVEVGENFTWKDRGCTGKWEHAVGADKPEPAIITEAWKLGTVNDESPEVLAIEKEWAQCMEAAGFAGETRREFVGYERLSAKFDAHYPRSEEPITSEADVPKYSAKDPVLVELKKEEIKLALADWDCAEKTDHDARLTAAITKLEQEFVDKNKKELEAALLEMGQ